MTQELKRHRRADWPETKRIRAVYPFQVEIRDWGARLARNAPRLTERLHAAYGGASWADHENCRTFGFQSDDEARLFYIAEGGVRLESTDD